VSTEAQKAGVAKKLMLGSWHSDEQATISIADLKSGEIVFAYSVNKRIRRTASKAQRKRVQYTSRMNCRERDSSFQRL
jgi:hypothetical protein